MKAVELVWEPSVSEGVDGQMVRIINIETLEPYGEAKLEPDASEFMAMCPEGATVQGIVVTVRGTQEQPAVSNTLTVPFGPLAPATGLTLAVAPQTQ